MSVGWLLILTAYLPAPGNDAACRTHPGPAVPDVNKARQVAEAVIARRQDRATSDRFELRVGREREGEDWIAVQQVHTRGDAGKSATAAHGLRFRIGYCTGKVTDLPEG